MQVTHPQGMYNGLPMEDVFIALDDMGTEMGLGYIVYQYQPHLYPDCPINLYFKLDCQPSARYILFGALVARARQLRDANPNVGARVYTDVNPADERTKEFYLHSGFACTDTEEVLELPIPQGDGRIPMSCAVAPVPLNTPEERYAFLSRLQQHDVRFMDENYLLNLQRLPHFLALGLYRNNDLIGEIVLAGEGSQCELVVMYIVPGSRRQGMGKALLHRCMAIMAAEGVESVNCRIMTRSIPMHRLCAAFGAKSLGVTMVYPSLPL
ncbi:MAG: GNAT family N-acetyltransferase [Clostridia bacterium]|nr:GNAT family N-acetyltransferase [Clostridia bacterium]